jgi:hypothetical protein
MLSKKIIYHVFSSKEKYGGVENYVCNIVKYSKYFHIKFNINLHSLFSLNNFFFFNSNLKYILKEKFIHFHGFTPSIIFKILMANNSNGIIWSVHFHPPKYTNRKYLSLFHVIFAAFILVTKKIKIITNSKEESKFLQNFFFLNKFFFVISTGHTYKRLVNKKKYYDGIYIARNEKHKNLELYCKLAKKFNKNKFCLITNQYYTNVKNLFVFNYPDNKKKEDLIASSRFFINTSNYESFGIASAESEMQGVPSIYNINIKYHLNIPALKNNLFYETNNFNSLSSVFSRLKKLNKYQYLILSKIRREYSLQFIFEKQIKLFDQLYQN